VVLMVGLMVKWHSVSRHCSSTAVAGMAFLLMMLALGVGLYAAALMVSYRDVQFILPVMVQLLLYGSPIAYSLSSVPAVWQKYCLLNPLTELLAAFRWSLLGSRCPI
jgi:lipopolysaccharide transport system permease protein